MFNVILFPDQDVHPVLSSVWLTTGEGDCLTTLANGSWMATDCDEKLQYVMCEGLFQIINIHEAVSMISKTYNNNNNNSSNNNNNNNNKIFTKETARNFTYQIILALDQ